MFFIIKKINVTDKKKTSKELEINCMAAGTTTEITNNSVVYCFLAGVTKYTQSHCLMCVVISFFLSFFLHGLVIKIQWQQQQCQWKIITDYY